MNFYALIIGTEILNGRREDKHFTFIKEELAKYGHELFASFIIKDDRALIKKAFELIYADKDAVMFSFGGIGSTPDDLTREIAADVFTQAKLIPHKKFLADIIERFAEEAYPHRVEMAHLPPNAELLFNPINNMSGFSLKQRYFFVPGFPSMAHPMLKDAINRYFSKKQIKFRKTLLAQTSENTLIEIMKRVPKEIELSSLPMFVQNRPNVELSLLGEHKESVEEMFQLFKDELEVKRIRYTLL